MNPLLFLDMLKGGSLLIVIGAIAYNLRHLPMKLFGMLKRVCTTTIAINNFDESFQWFNIWLAKELDGVHSIMVNSKLRQSDDDLDKPQNLDLDEDRNGKHRPKIILTPANGFYFFKFGGKYCFLNRSRGEVKSKEDFGKSTETFTITILSRDLSIAKKLVEAARDYALPEDGRLDVRICRHDFWNHLGRINKRLLDSVIMPCGLKERLLEDVCKFRESRDWYVQMGIPYKRGYLLAGNPGTGKSSLVMAIASHFDMSLCVLSLSASGMSDSTLLHLLGNADTNSILLIEDVEAAWTLRQE